MLRQAMLAHQCTVFRSTSTPGVHNTHTLARTGALDIGSKPKAAAIPGETATLREVPTFGRSI